MRSLPYNADNHHPLHHLFLLHRRGLLILTAGWTAARALRYGSCRTFHSGMVPTTPRYGSCCHAFTPLIYLILVMTTWTVCLLTRSGLLEQHPTPPLPPALDSSTYALLFYTPTPPILPGAGSAATLPHGFLCLLVLVKDAAPLPLLRGPCLLPLRIADSSYVTLALHAMLPCRRYLIGLYVG